MENGKHILVTGGAGFIGSSYVAQAVERGEKVIVLDALTYAGHKENLEWITPDPQSGGSYELVVGDINDRPLIDRLLQENSIDYLINFAAESHVDNSIASSAAFIKTNINGTHTLLEAARSYWNQLEGEKKEHFRYLQVSTDEVYGSLGEEGKFDENYPMQPNSPYSASKASADNLVRAWFHTYGLPTITTNCSNNYGPRQLVEKLIPKVITSAMNGTTIPVYGDGKNIRDWIHVEDHCYGVYLALTKGRVGETYCLGGRSERTNIDIVQSICQLLQELVPGNSDYTSHIKHVTDRLGHDRRYAINDQKAESELGFTRKYQFEDGLRQTVQWYIDNQQWCQHIISKLAA